MSNAKSDPTTVTDGEHDDIVYPSAIPFVLVHLACIGAIWTGITWQAVAIAVVLYWLRIFAIGAGYHRYFSHRAYATSRAAQFVLAALAQSTAQRSVLWWAGKAPASPPALRHRARRPLAAPQGLPCTATSDGSSPPNTTPPTS